MGAKITSIEVRPKFKYAIIKKAHRRIRGIQGAFLSHRQWVPVNGGQTLSKC